MTGGESFEKKGNCKHGPCSPMSNSASTDLQNHCKILKLHNICGKMVIKTKYKVTRRNI